jgi:hypothetical protein
MVSIITTQLVVATGVGPVVIRNQRHKDVEGLHPTGIAPEPMAAGELVHKPGVIVESSKRIKTGITSQG